MNHNLKRSSALLHLSHSPIGVTPLAVSRNSRSHRSCSAHSGTGTGVWEGFVRIGSTSRSCTGMKALAAGAAPSGPCVCALPAPSQRVCAPCAAAAPQLRQPSGLRHRQRRSVQRVARRRTMHVSALDAAMPFDFESKAQARVDKAKQLIIGIVGFGTFGQFLARRMVQAGHRVMATSRGDYSAAAAGMGVEFWSDPNDFCESHPDIVILASSITSTEAVLRSLPLQRLKRNTLFVDVLSVKEFPKRIFLSLLPPEVDILCTHPMFGPDSGKGSWAGLKFMYEKVRIGTGERRQKRVNRFLEFFSKEGCDMEEMTCERHDELASRTQFITHTVGRLLGAMDLQATSIDTRGFRSLLDLVNNTNNDSFELYYGLFAYNQNATEELMKLEQCFDVVKKQLFDRMHAVVRQQLFHPTPPTPQQQGLLSPAAGVGDDRLLPHPEDASTAAAGHEGADGAEVTSRGSANGSKPNVISKL